MQSDYVPYLLPLLSWPTGGGQFSRASTGLEEERQLLAQGFCDWEALAKSCRAHYGVGLLASLPAETVVEATVGSEDGTLPCLRLRAGNVRWFAIPHPRCMAAADQSAGTGETITLLRPSLWEALLGQAAAASARTSSEAMQAESRPTDSEAAALALDQLRGMVRRQHPSDWHLDAMGSGYQSRLRIHGQLTAGEHLPREQARWWINALLRIARLADKGEQCALEGGFELPGKDVDPVGVRLSVIPSLHGPSLVARFLYPGPAVTELTSLGLQSPSLGALDEQWSQPGGLWLACGPTGSGKSTTLYALLQRAVAGGQKVLSVEDPVEQRIAGVQQVAVGQPQGMSFDLALRAFLRHAPDCLMVGEIRDEGTAAGVLQAVRSGHRVFASLHAADSPGALRRFADLGQSPADWHKLRPVLLHQRLLQLRCPHCCSERPVAAADAARFAAAGLRIPDRFPQTDGCPLCCNGAAGRTALVRIDLADRPLFPPLAELQAQIDRQPLLLSGLIGFLDHAHSRLFALSKNSLHA